MEQEITVQDIISYWYEAGYTPLYKDMPSYYQEEIAIKLFENSPIAGDKGKQDDILNEMFEYLNVDYLYNLGLLPDAYILELDNYNNELVEEMYNIHSLQESQLNNQ